LDYSAYVLEDFEEREGEILEEVLERSSRAVNTILSDGLERAMALYN
jgi:peptidyl-tRNA hydrolase